jgi:hypothetical protein
MGLFPQPELQERIGGFGFLLKPFQTEDIERVLDQPATLLGSFWLHLATRARTGEWPDAEDELCRKYHSVGDFSDVPMSPSRATLVPL